MEERLQYLQVWIQMKAKEQTTIKRPSTDELVGWFLTDVTSLMEEAGKIIEKEKNEQHKRSD